MIFKMDKHGQIYTLGVDERPVFKKCYREVDRICGIDCMHFWESRNPKGEIDSVQLQCVPKPSPLIPIEVDK